MRYSSYSPAFMRKTKLRSDTSVDPRRRGSSFSSNSMSQNQPLRASAGSGARASEHQPWNSGTEVQRRRANISTVHSVQSGENSACDRADQSGAWLAMFPARPYPIAESKVCFACQRRGPVLLTTQSRRTQGLSAVPPGCISASKSAASFWACAASERFGCCVTLDNKATQAQIGLESTHQNRRPRPSNPTGTAGIRHLKWHGGLSEHLVILA